MKKAFLARPEKIFAMLATLFIGVSIFVMPLNRVPDEANHAKIMWMRLHVTDENSFDWFHSVDNQTQIDRNQYKKLFTKKIDLSHERFQWNAKLKDLVHLPQYLGMLFGKLIYPSVGVMFTFGRIFNALFYIICLYFIIKISKFGKYTLMFVSLLPIMIQQAASLSYDVFNFVAIAAFFGLITNLAAKKVMSKKLVGWLLLTTVGLYITKANNMLLLLIVPFTGIRFPEKYRLLNNLIEKASKWFKRYKVPLLGSLAIIVLLLATYLFKSRGGIIHFTQIMINTLFDNHLNGHLNGIITTGIIGYLGNFTLQLPMWLIYLDFAFLVILMMSNDEVPINQSLGLVSGLMFPLQVCAVVGGMYFAWTPKDYLISVGAQGRYFTPFLLYFTPLFMSFKNRLKLVYDATVIRMGAIGLIILNFLIMLFLVLLVFWYPQHESDWLIQIRQLMNN